MKRKKESGFTLVEVVLALTLLAIISIPFSMGLFQGVEGYQFVAERVESSQEARLGFQRIREELIRLPQGALLQIAPTRIDFRDSGGVNTSFRLQGTDLYRGNDLLLQRVQSLIFSYYDQNAQVTSQLANVRRIGVNLIQQVGEVGSPPVVYQTEIFPRSFMYQTFQ